MLHGFSSRTVNDVAGSSPRFRKNLRGRAATHQMIGPDAEAVCGPSAYCTSTMASGEPSQAGHPHRRKGVGIGPRPERKKNRGEGMNAEDRLAEELERTRDDQGEWSEDAVTIEVRAKPTQVVSFRLSVDEVERLNSYVTASGETLSEWIREAIDLRIEGSGTQLFDFSHSFRTFTIFGGPARSGYNISLEGINQELSFQPYSNELTPLPEAKIG